MSASGSPSVRTLPEDGFLEVRKGEYVDIGCEASGTPQPTFEWRKNVSGTNTVIRTSFLEKETITGRLRETPQSLQRWYRLFYLRVVMPNTTEYTSTSLVCVR